MLPFIPQNEADLIYQLWGTTDMKIDLLPLKNLP